MNPTIFEGIRKWLIARGVPVVVATLVAGLIAAGLLLGGCAGYEVRVDAIEIVRKPSVSSSSNPAPSESVVVTPRSE